MRNIYIIILFSIFTKLSLGQSGCEIIDYSTTVEVKNNKLIEERSYIIQINRKDSDWISNIEISYKEQDKLNILEASIIDLNGETIRKLKKKEIITRNDISRGAFYEDSWVKEFNLKWNQYPYRIKYKYRKTKDKFIFISHWHPALYTSIPTQKASLKVILPTNYDVTINESKDFKHNTNELEGNKILDWEVKDISPISRESFSPPIQELISSVKIIPKHFNYDIQGSFETWSAYGQWIEALNEGLDVLTFEEKLKVNKLIDGVKDKKEIVTILYRYLQENTRYINISIDIGGLKPYPASYVCKKKYGDCKALTIYMKALLKHAGIRSFYTLIHAGANPIRINKEMPSQQFNHVILNVPIANDTIWLENTASHYPLNYLGTFTQDRYGLMVNGTNTSLIKTKPLKLDDVLEQNIYSFNLDMNGKGDLNLSKKLKGKAFETYQYVRYDLDEKEQKQQIEDDLTIKNYETTSWEFSEADPDKKSIKLNVSLTVDNQVRKIGNMVVLKPISNQLIDLEKPKSRKMPLRINYPINQRDSITYKLPFTDQFEVELPKDIIIVTEFGSYTENYTKSNNQLRVSRNFELYSGDYSLKAYSAVYSFVQKIKESQKKSVIILNQL